MYRIPLYKKKKHLNKQTDALAQQAFVSIIDHIRKQHGGAKRAASAGGGGAKRARLAPEGLATGAPEETEEERAERVRREMVQLGDVVAEETKHYTNTFAKSKGKKADVVDLLEFHGTMEIVTHWTPPSLRTQNLGVGRKAGAPVYFNYKTFAKDVMAGKYGAKLQDQQLPHLKGSVYNSEDMCEWFHKQRAALDKIKKEKPEWLRLQDGALKFATYMKARGPAAWRSIIRPTRRRARRNGSRT